MQLLLHLPQLYFLLWTKNRLMKLSTERFESQQSLQFHQIQDIIQRKQLHELGRNPAQEELYQRRRAELAQLWETPSDCILHDKFHLNYDLSVTGKRQISRPLPLWTTGLIKTVPNDFPYNFKEDVLHLVLWKLGEEVTQTDVVMEIEKLREVYPFSGSCSFINPPHLKSIPDIDHAHIILQINETGTGAAASPLTPSASSSSTTSIVPHTPTAV
jgi:hypothetical protein